MQTMKIVMRILVVVTLTIGSWTVPALARKTEADREAAAKVVQTYHEALAGGDEKAAMQLLAADAVILEGGGLETREEYLSHHLTDDIRFAQAVPSRRSPVQVTVNGDVAWATSTSETQGSFRNRAIDIVGAELMVLTRTDTGWVIRAIHWSSRPRS